MPLKLVIYYPWELLLRCPIKLAFQYILCYKKIEIDDLPYPQASPAFP